MPIYYYANVPLCAIVLIILAYQIGFNKLNLYAKPQKMKTTINPWIKIIADKFIWLFPNELT